MFIFKLIESQYLRAKQNNKRGQIAWFWHSCSPFSLVLLVKYFPLLPTHSTFLIYNLLHHRGKQSKKCIHNKIRGVLHYSCRDICMLMSRELNIVILIKHFASRFRKKWIQILVPLGTMSNSTKPLRLSFLWNGNNNSHYT